jgi:hypothetical protein
MPMQGAAEITGNGDKYRQIQVKPTKYMHNMGLSQANFPTTENISLFKHHRF